MNRKSTGWSSTVLKYCLRAEAELSQERLGEITGLDRTYASGIERGVRNPVLKNIEKLARALKVEIGDLAS